MMGKLRILFGVYNVVNVIFPSGYLSSIFEIEILRLLFSPQNFMSVVICWLINHGVLHLSCHMFWPHLQRFLKRYIDLS
jgi:hypothetical protein